MNVLSTIYIAAAIFGFGIVLIDLISAMSGATDGDDSHGDDDVGHASDGADGGAASDADGHVDAAGHTIESDSDDVAAEHDGSHMTQQKKHNINIVFRIIGAMRTFVYFSFGFGAMGWFALVMGKSMMTSLIWSVAVGVIITVLAKMLRKIQRTELDSQFTNDEIIMSKAEVIVSINKGQMGKVRILIGNTYLERYAKAFDESMEYSKGKKVRVVEIKDEYMLVE